MSSHLDDSQLTAALASGSLDQQARDHIDSCIVCRRRLKAFLDPLSERRRYLAASAPDFDEQKTTILSRLVSEVDKTPEQRRRGWVRPFFAAAATALLVIGAGLLRNSFDPPLAPTPRPELPIEEILAETEALLADETIPGFAVLDHLSEKEIDTLLAEQYPKL